MELNEKTKRILQNIKGATTPIDEGILPLVNSINSLKGIVTVESCGGHPDRYPFVLFKVDGSEQAMASVCIIAHTLKGYGWKLVAVPVGSVGELFLRFIVLPGLALKEWIPDEPTLRILSSSPGHVKIEQDRIEDLAGRLATVSKTSRFVPEEI